MSSLPEWQTTVILFRVLGVIAGVVAAYFIGGDPWTLGFLGFLGGFVLDGWYEEASTARYWRRREADRLQNLKSSDAMSVTFEKGKTDESC